jgi:hypothetical protein
VCVGGGHNIEAVYRSRWISDMYNWKLAKGIFFTHALNADFFYNVYRCRPSGCVFTILKEVRPWALQFQCAGCYRSDTDPIGANIYIAHVLLNSIQVPNNVQVIVQILKGLYRDYILGRKVTLAKKFEIWTISQFLHHQRNLQFFF